MTKKTVTTPGDCDEDEGEKTTPELSGQNTLGAAMSLSIFWRLHNPQQTNFWYTLADGDDD